MSIKKYTNFEAVNNKTENEGKYLQAEDIFIVTKNEIEETEFGECKYDVMEVSVYDINNNLLPQKSGNNVAYIKTGDIKNYMYSLTNQGGQQELAIDIEKLLKDLGFSNGILKVNINFVRNKVGSENELSRVWIQEISPSREEIRILPLKTKDDNVTKMNDKEFNNLQNLNKDFKYYKKTILDSLTSFENNFLTKIDDYLVSKYGNDFFNILKVDFGLSKFDNYRKKIFDDYKDSVTYYLTNKYYNISDSNFGKPAGVRFEDCDVYSFDMISTELQNILFNCINHNSNFFKRREVKIKSIPKEFQVVELVKEAKNNLDSFETYTEKKRNVYNPSKIDFELDDTATSEPIYKKPDLVIIREDPPPVFDLPIEQPGIPDPPVIVRPIEIDSPPPQYVVEEPVRILPIFDPQSVLISDVLDPNIPTNAVVTPEEPATAPTVIRTNLSGGTSNPRILIKSDTTYGDPTNTFSSDLNIQ